MFHQSCQARRFRVICLACLIVWLPFVGAEARIQPPTDAILGWAMARLFPKLDIQIARAEISGASELEIIGIRIRVAGSDHDAFTADRILVRFAPQRLWSHEVDELLVESPRVLVDDPLLDAIGLGSLRGNAPDVAPEGSEPWTIGKIRVRNGFGKLATANLPEIGFRLEASIDADRIQVVRFEQVEVVSGNGEAAGGIGLVEIRLDLDQLAKNTIKSITLKAPSLRLTPQVVQLFGAGGGGAGAAGTPEAKLADWFIEQVRVEDGEFLLSGFGGKVPETSFKLSATLKDVATSPANPASRRNQAVSLYDVRLATGADPLQPFLRIPRAQIDFSVADLHSRKIGSFLMEDGDLVMDRSFRSLVAAGDAAAPAAGPPGGSPWTIGQVVLADSRITVADLGIGIPSVAFTLKRSKLRNLALSADPEFASEETERLEVADFIILSPLDPFAPVINLRSIFVEFSVAGLLRRQIDSLVFLQPTIYVGEDLFWYVDTVRRRQQEEEQAAAASETGPAAPPNLPDWQLKRFKVAYGRLALATAGAARVSLPINFMTEAENIHFQSFNDLQLKLNILVPREDYDFPSYRLALRDLHGDLKFGLPPESGANNLVNTLQSAEAVWRQFRGKDLWMSVTYDRRGIYGGYGGTIYSGYVTGGFSFFLRRDYPWTGWVSGSGIDMAQLTGVLAPESFRMTGPADFKVEVDATSSRIQRVVGSVTVLKPGVLTIAKLNDLIPALPPAWSGLKRDLTTIGLETLQEFEYDSGNAGFWFIEKHGRLSLKLAGPNGSRNFDVVIHDNLPGDPGLWQKNPTPSGEMEIGAR